MSLFIKMIDCETAIKNLENEIAKVLDSANPSSKLITGEYDNIEHCIKLVVGGKDCSVSNGKYMFSVFPCDDTIPTVKGYIEIIKDEYHVTVTSVKS